MSALSSKGLSVRKAEDIAAIRSRLAKAEHDRDTFLAAGMSERHLEACSMVEALELQLQRQYDASLHAKRENEGMLADFRIAERIANNAGRDMADLPEHRERLMLAFDITFDGRKYVYGPYRYDRLADAVNFARLQLSRPSSTANEGCPLGVSKPCETPTVSQEKLMSEFGITFEAGVYRLKEYRYDRLDDAIEYARIKTGT
jgi:hypothetical protein